MLTTASSYTPDLTLPAFTSPGGWAVVPSFNAETHTYAVKGKPMVGVSALLDAVGLKGATDKLPTHVQKIVKKAMDKKADHGNEIHEWTAFYDKHPHEGWGYLPLDWQPFVETWDTACDHEHAPRPWALIETPVAVPLLGLAGCPDRVGANAEVWDIKGGMALPYHRWQVALYALMVNPPNAPFYPPRVVVYLHPNGLSFSVKRFTVQYDIEVARAAITLYNARKQHGLL